MLATSTSAEPVKWADGRITEASELKLQPAVLVLATDKGTEKVELRNLDPEWIKKKFPEEDAAAMQATFLLVEKEIQRLRGSQPDPQAINRVLRQLQSQIKALEEENAKLKEDLKKQRKPSRK